jgi:hypothetical protein
MNLILNFQQQYLSTLDTLNFSLFLLAILHLQGSDVLKSKFLSHG